ncbi:hypothetical protein BC827DRAFT_390640 [Russula dissimulans]|nr:hypothetical protein BC827DRAFT_390640 [Russula dissimulans]
MIEYHRALIIREINSHVALLAWLYTQLDRKPHNTTTLLRVRSDRSPQASGVRLSESKLQLQANLRRAANPPPHIESGSAPPNVRVQPLSLVLLPSDPTFWASPHGRGPPTSSRRRFRNPGKPGSPMRQKQFSLRRHASSSDVAAPPPSFGPIEAHKPALCGRNPIAYVIDMDITPPPISPSTPGI